MLVLGGREVMLDWVLAWCAREAWVMSSTRAGGALHQAKCTQCEACGCEALRYQ